MPFVARWISVVVVGVGLMVGVAASASAQWSSDVWVDRYQRQDGTVVQPHYRTAPNNQLWDNYSSQGQVNPYTGVPGTKPHEFSTPPAYQKGRMKPSW